MRNPLSALQAFTRDAEAPVGSSGMSDRIYDVAQADTREDALARWLGVAKAAERLTTLSPRKRTQYLASLAPELLPPSDARPTQTHDVQPAPTDELGRLAERIRVHAEQMEHAGCFELAYTTVAAVCQLTAHATRETRLLATMQLGRIARQLGDLDAAEDCYRKVTDEAVRLNDPALAALGFVGLGNLARNRGNRPAERSHYEQAIALAHVGGHVDAMASQGLMNVALSEHRLIDALLYGWRAYDLVEGDKDNRAMILSNLALTSLEADFVEAAYKGFVHSLAMTSIARVRLPAIGGAMRAAARLRQDVEVRRLNEDGDREASAARIPFESARFLMYAGEAWTTVGDVAFARRRFADSRAIAAQHGFHEIVHKVDEAIAALESAQSLPTRHNVTVETAEESAELAMVSAGVGRLEALQVSR